MDPIVIPPSPTWFNPDIMACSSDNVLIYGSYQDLVIIKSTEGDVPDDVRVIPRIHHSLIISVSINKSWGKPFKLVATMSANKVVKIWDIDTMERIAVQDQKGTLNNFKPVGATFAGENVVSVNEKGTLVIWKHFKEETVVHKFITPLIKGTTVKCFSVCPHASWLMAFGLKNGLVIVADLRDRGRVIHTLRGHIQSVLSFSWCPATVNVFPKNPNNWLVEEKVDDLVLQNSDDGHHSTPNKNTDNKHTEVEENESSIEDLPHESAQSSAVQSDAELKDVSDLPELSKQADNEKVVIKNDPQLDPIAMTLDGIADSESVETNIEPSDLNRTRDEGVVLKKVSQFDPIATRSNGTTDSESVESNSEPSDLNQTSDEGVLTPSSNGNLDSESVETKVEDTELYKAPIGHEEKPRKEYLLASLSQDRSIYIWRAGTDGRMQTFMFLSGNKNPRKYKENAKNDDSKCCYTLCWAAPCCLFSAFDDGKLLMWTLPKPKGHSKMFKIVHGYHWKHVFSIKTPIKYFDASNFLQRDSLSVWTTGMERLTLHYDVIKEQELVRYYGFGGCIKRFASSPIDPCRIAFADGGDKSLYTCDLTKVGKKTLPFKTYYQQICSHVTAVAWHPKLEYILAWGTEEGRVGLFDTSGQWKTKVFRQYYQSEIYKLEWGPKYLFAVTSGKIAMLEMEHIDSGPKELEIGNEDLTLSVYTLAWKPSYEKLMIVTHSGPLLEYDRDLKLKTTYYPEGRLKSFIWHPNAVSDENQIFVSLVKHTDFTVYDLSIPDLNFSKKIIASFQNRNVKINDISWSPHNANYLVFVDDAFVAQVFDIKQNAIISTYFNQWLASFSCVYWNPSDPESIISGTTSRKIVIWKYTNYPVLSTAEINNRKNRLKRSQAKDKSNGTSSSSNKDSSMESTDSKKAKFTFMPKFYAVKGATQVSDIRSLLDWKLGKIDNAILENSAATKISVLDVFSGDRKGSSVFDANISDFQQSKNYETVNLLKLMRGDVADSIKECIEKRVLTPSIIAICPMVSPGLWQTACEAYVQQLLEEPNANPTEVVTYMLVCHKVEECAEYLCKKNMFKDAYLLVKARCGSDHPMIADILLEWAKQNGKCGAYEMAACCYVTIGKFGEASSMLLNRHNNYELLELSVELAKLSGNEELTNAAVNALQNFGQSELNGCSNEGKEIVQQENGQDLQLVESASTNLGCAIEIGETVEQEIHQDTQTVSSMNQECINGVGKNGLCATAKPIDSTGVDDASVEVCTLQCPSITITPCSPKKEE